MAHISSGPLLRITDPDLSAAEAAQQIATAETEDGEEIAGWVDVDYVEKLDKMAEALYEKADCQRIFSNLYGWPAR